MAIIARLIGGAGTGKTTELLAIMERVIEQGIDPLTIGFVSFTRAARAEASARAASLFGCKVEELERNGWFRTLHSVCYRCLGSGDELLTGNRKSTEWIQEALQAAVDFSEAGDDELGQLGSSPKTDAATALALWDAARNRLEGYDVVWSEARNANDNLPSLAKCREWVERYELHKAIDHRRDFCDLLGQFAGVAFGLDGVSRGEPQGFVPDAPVWFFDEQQDASRLLDAVCHRLIEHDECRWVYVVGDPFQAVYRFAGADSRCFRAWPADKERIMPKSYRCPRPIHELGERCLADCSDYWDRGIQPADHEGCVEEDSMREVVSAIDPRDSWLLLARTNYQARRWANLLNQSWVPWKPTRGNGGWQAPKRNLAINALIQLQGSPAWPIGPDEWRAILDAIPAKYCEEALLVRGTKSKWGLEEFRSEEEYADLRSLRSWGATDRLCEMIAQGAWKVLIEHSDRYVSAAQRWGTAAVEEPGVRVGTIHSVKGSEADNVALLTTTSEPIARSMETVEGADEERRVAYVAVTRASRRLVIVDEPRERNRMEIPL